MSTSLSTNVDAKALRTTKFPPEFNVKVNMAKVNVPVIKKWAADQITRILNNDDDVVPELVFMMLEKSQPNIKELQINLGGFLDKDAPKFCKQLWNLCISAASSPQGVPKELLEAKKQELERERIEEDQARTEASQRQEAERRRERELDEVRQRERPDRHGRPVHADQPHRAHRDMSYRRSRSPPRYRDRDDRDRDIFDRVDRERDARDRYDRYRYDRDHYEQGRQDQDRRFRDRQEQLPPASDRDTYHPPRGRTDGEVYNRRRSPSYDRRRPDFVSRSRSPNHHHRQYSSSMSEASRSQPERREPRNRDRSLSRNRRRPYDYPIDRRLSPPRRHQSYSSATSSRPSTASSALSSASNSKHAGLPPDDLMSDVQRSAGERRIAARRLNREQGSDQL